MAIYPGTFDPCTFGHLDIIKRARHIFPEVIVAVAHNAGKKPLFSVEERVAMLKKATRGMKGVSVVDFNCLAVDFARSLRVNILIRGVRMLSDYEYEFQMALTNRKLSPDIETIFLMPQETFSYISSKLLKEGAALKADLSAFVPDFIAEALAKKSAMKIYIDQIGPEGLIVHETTDPGKLDLGTEVAEFYSPLTIEARLERVDNVVNVSLIVQGNLTLTCCRCLSEYNVGFYKEFCIDYTLEKGVHTIDLDPEIRDYVMLDYPLKPLCKEDCKGLCPGCGANLNNITKCDCG